ncbi:MAG TPA: hypothetical protein VF281_04570 [Candidatus Saccharimonadales bacterium]
MDKPSGKKHMDITTRPAAGGRRSGLRMSQRQAIIISLVIVALILGWFGLQTFLHRNEQRIDHSRYQAVFLDDGKVFFGKLQNSQGEYLTLSGAYYTQGQTGENEAPSTNVQLVKVGDETYGPESTMSIQSNKVLFWQNLKSDSKVTKAIDAQK